MLMFYTMGMINAIGIQINERSAQIGIDQGFENIVYKRPNSKYFRHGVNNYSTLQSYCKKTPYTILIWMTMVVFMDTEI